MTDSNPALVLIAAVARNRIIGRGCRMPWHLPGDLAHFRAKTMGKPVIFGRTTFESIGAPLEGRHCIVLSRDPLYRPNGVEVCPTLAGAVALANAVARTLGVDAVMVAGGASVYAEALGQADTLLVTDVDLSPDGDAMFPTIDPVVWRELDRTPALRRTDEKAPYDFVRYQRR